MTDEEKKIAQACEQVNQSYTDYVNDVMTTPITVKQALDQLSFLINEDREAENQRLKKAILDYGNNPAGFDWAVLERIDRLEAVIECEIEHVEAYDFIKREPEKSNWRALKKRLEMALSKESVA